MKKLKFFSLALMIVFTSANSLMANNSQSRIKRNSTTDFVQHARFKKIHFVATFNGYTVTIDGDINYSVWSGNYTFTGTIHITGHGLDINSGTITVNGHVGSRLMTGNKSIDSTVDDDDFQSQWDAYVETL